MYSPWLLGLLGLLAGCSSSSPSPTVRDAAATVTPTGFKIVTSSGGPLQGTAGATLTLKVVQLLSDGSTRGLPSGAEVAWSGPLKINAAPPGGGAPVPFPPPAPEASAIWINNPPRADRNDDLSDVLFLLDAGTQPNPSVEVLATISNLPGTEIVTAAITVSPMPAGVASQGAVLYGSHGANCAQCHGPTGHGSPPEAGMKYNLGGGTYSFPAPGLNAERGNPASDPSWSAALMAMASRADMDNAGITLRKPMPDWLTDPNPSTGQPLTTQDFADIYAFLKTQTH